MMCQTLKVAVLLAFIVETTFSEVKANYPSTDGFEKYDFLDRLSFKIHEIKDYNRFDEENKFHKKLRVIIYYSKDKCL